MTKKRKRASAKVPNNGGGQKSVASDQALESAVEQLLESKTASVSESAAASSSDSRGAASNGAKTKEQEIEALLERMIVSERAFIKYVH